MVFDFKRLNNLSKYDQYVIGKIENNEVVKNNLNELFQDLNSENNLISEEDFTSLILDNTDVIDTYIVQLEENKNEYYVPTLKLDPDLKRLIIIKALSKKGKFISRHEKNVVISDLDENKLIKEGLTNFELLEKMNKQKELINSSNFMNKLNKLVSQLNSYKKGMTSKSDYIYSMNNLHDKVAKILIFAACNVGLKVGIVSGSGLFTNLASNSIGEEVQEEYQKAFDVDVLFVLNPETIPNTYQKVTETSFIPLLVKRNSDSKLTIISSIYSIDELSSIITTNRSSKEKVMGILSRSFNSIEFNDLPIFN